jgi:hypothetical protein
LRKQWGECSPAFKLVDIVAHHFKHVESDDEKNAKSGDKPRSGSGIPLSSVVFGTGGGPLNDGMDLHNLYFTIGDAIEFIRKQG